MDALRSAIRVTPRTSLTLFLLTFLASSLVILRPGSGTKALLRDQLVVIRIGSGKRCVTTLTLAAPHFSRSLVFTTYRGTTEFVSLCIFTTGSYKTLHKGLLRTYRTYIEVKN